MSTNELNYLDNLIGEMKAKEQEQRELQEEIDALKALVREALQRFYTLKALFQDIL